MGSQLGKPGPPPSDTDAALAPKLPRDRLAADSDRNLLPESLLDYWPPGDEAESHAVIKHGEATADELDAPAVDTAGVLTVLYRAVGLPGLLLDGLSGCSQFHVAQGCQQIACEHNSLAALLGQTSFDQKIDTVAHCIAHLRPKALASQGRTVAH